MGSKGSSILSCRIRNKLKQTQQREAWRGHVNSKAFIKVEGQTQDIQLSVQTRVLFYVFILHLICNLCFS